nr:coenzyme F420-0:L-glutamate ligase [Mycetocola reblochoni]
MPGIPEITDGDDLGAIVAAALTDAGGVSDGDVVVVASKVVAKAEGRLVRAEDREQAITDEAVRVVASRTAPDGRTTRIVQTRHGFVMAAAGVDASNVPEGHVLLLPVDPDGSARALRRGIAERTGRRIGVVVTDTFGRPWRNGQTDLAVGAAGLAVVDDARGSVDRSGRPLSVSVAATVDQIASAADLVRGKASGTPVVVVSGLDVVTEEDGPGVAVLVRDAGSDMFRWGSDEAYARGRADAERG